VSEVESHKIGNADNFMDRLRPLCSSPKFPDISAFIGPLTSYPDIAKLVQHLLHYNEYFVPDPMLKVLTTIEHAIEKMLVIQPDGELNDEFISMFVIGGRDLTAKTNIGLDAMRDARRSLAERAKSVF